MSNSFGIAIAVTLEVPATLNYGNSQTITHAIFLLCLGYSRNDEDCWQQAVSGRR
jgi:hypothetical protein